MQNLFKMSKQYLFQLMKTPYISCLIWTRKNLILLSLTSQTPLALHQQNERELLVELNIISSIYI